MTELIRYPNNNILATMVNLGSEFIIQSQYSHIVYDKESVINSLVYFCQNQNDFYVAAITDTSEVLGYLIGKRSPCWFAHNYYIASDLIIYVDPRHRTTRLARMLINDFSCWAKSFNCNTDIVLGSSASFYPERITRFYQHIGFEPIGLISRKVGV